MLMMLSWENWVAAGLLEASWEKRVAADAHDAGPLGASWEKRVAADAHDAGFLAGLVGETGCR